MIYENEEGLTNGLRILAKTHFETMDRPYYEDEIDNIISYIELENITATLLKLALDGIIVMTWDEKTKQPMYRLSKEMRKHYDKQEIENLISSLDKK